MCKWVAEVIGFCAGSLGGLGIELLGVVYFGRGAGYVADGNEGCEGKEPKLRPEKYCGGRGIFREDGMGG